MTRIRNLSPRRLIPWAIGILALVVASAALTSTSQSSVTRARLERDLPRTFSNLYVQQAALLGHKGVSAKSMHTQAQCDKGGPKVADRGAGADWICYVSWRDPNVDETLMPGKFEVSAHSNNCYTAGGPSKLVGLLTITDKHGRDVPNPVFEFDGCFDPHGSNEPTGVNLEPTKSSPTGPAALTIATSSVRPDARGVIRPKLSCAPGQEGCGGSVVARLDGKRVGTATYALAPDSKGAVEIELPRGATGSRLVLAVTPVIGDTVRPAFTVRIAPR